MKSYNNDNKLFSDQIKQNFLYNFLYTLFFTEPRDQKAVLRRRVVPHEAEKS